MPDNHVEAVRSLRTGAIVLLNDVNRAGMLAKHDMVSTTAVQDDTGRWVDANGAEGVGAAAYSNSLARIAETLASLASQRQQLIAAAMKLPGGEALLAERGIEFAAAAQVAPLPADDEGTQESPAPVATSKNKGKGKPRLSLRDGSDNDGI